MRPHDWKVLALIAVCAVPSLAFTAMLTARSQGTEGGVSDVIRTQERRIGVGLFYIRSDGTIVPAERTIRGRPYSFPPEVIKVLPLRKTPIEYDFQFVPKKVEALPHGKTRIEFFSEFPLVPGVRAPGMPPDYGDAIRFAPAGG